MDAADGGTGSPAADGAAEAAVDGGGRGGRADGDGCICRPPVVDEGGAGTGGAGAAETKAALGRLPKSELTLKWELASEPVAPGFAEGAPGRVAPETREAPAPEAAPARAGPGLPAPEAGPEPEAAPEAEEVSS